MHAGGPQHCPLQDQVRSEPACKPSSLRTNHMQDDRSTNSSHEKTPNSITHQEVDRRGDPTDAAKFQSDTALTALLPNDQLALTLTLDTSTSNAPHP